MFTNANSNASDGGIGICCYVPMLFYVAVGSRLLWNSFPIQGWQLDVSTADHHLCSLGATHTEDNKPQATSDWLWNKLLNREQGEEKEEQETEVELNDRVQPYFTHKCIQKNYDQRVGNELHFTQVGEYEGCSMQSGTVLRKDMWSMQIRRWLLPFLTVWIITNTKLTQGSPLRVWAFAINPTESKH